MTGAIIGLLGAIIPRIANYFESRAEHRREMEIMRFQAELPPVPPQTKEMVNIDLGQREIIAQSQEKLFQHTSKKGGAVLAFIIGAVRPTVTIIAIASFFYVLVFKEYRWPAFAEDIIFFIVTFYFGDRALRRR